MLERGGWGGAKGKKGLVGLGKKTKTLEQPCNPLGQKKTGQKDHEETGGTAPKGGLF